MLIAQKYRLYPNNSQAELMNKHFGCCRYIYNWALDKRIKHYKETGETLSAYSIIKDITDLKKQVDTSWLADVSISALQQEVLHMETAYRKFFKEKKGFPKFKAKNHSKDSYSLPINVSIKKGRIRIAKLGLVKCRPYSEKIGKIKTCTVSRSKSGKYYISILFETDQIIPGLKLITEQGSIGIDTGIKNFVTCSDGRVFENPQYLRKSLKKVQILSKRFSRKQKGSSNRNKARIRLAKAYEKVANQRLDYLRKVVSELTNGENQADSIFIEDLNLIGMQSNRRLALSLQDSSLGLFYEILGYKCRWQGINLIKIGRFEPSSKLCTCGFKHDELKLSDRVWTCPNCGETHDRDLFAAQNIKRFGLNKISGGGTAVEPLEVSAMVEPMKEECLTI